MAPPVAAVIFWQFPAHLRHSSAQDFMLLSSLNEPQDFAQRIHASTQSAAAFAEYLDPRARKSPAYLQEVIQSLRASVIDCSPYFPFLLVQ